MMRVRDLSTQLNISNKDLLHLLREEHIPVKSHMSGLTEEQVQLVRQKIIEHGRDGQSQRKVTSSGVIVRRRRHPKKEEAAPPSPPADQAEVETAPAEPTETEAPKVPETPEKPAPMPEAEESVPEHGPETAP